MKRRTDFVTNSSSMSYVMAFLFGIPIALGAGVGATAAYVGQGLGHAVGGSTGGPAPGTAGSPGQATAGGPPADPARPRGELAWGGDAYILTGAEAAEWLAERGLMEGGEFTNAFWDDWYSPLPSDERPPVKGLRAVGGDWKFERGSVPGVISILVDDPRKIEPDRAGGAPVSTAQPDATQPPDEDKGTEETPAAAGGPRTGGSAIDLLDSDTADEAEQPGAGDQKGAKPVRGVPYVPVSPPPVVPPAKPPSVEKPAPPAGPSPAGPDTGAAQPAAPPSPNVQKIEQLLAQQVPDRSKLAGITAQWQLTVSGPNGGSYNVQIKDGQYTVTEGWARKPNVVITMPSETFERAVAGQLGLGDAKAVLADMTIQEDGSGMQTLEAIGVKINWLAKPLIEAKIEVDRRRLGRL